MKHKNNMITHRKSEIKSIIEDSRKIISIYGFKCKKTVVTRLKKTLFR